MKKAKSLLAKAKGFQPPQRKRPPVTADGAELAVAWASGEITYTQAQVALERGKGASVYGVLACGLRDALKLGLLVRTVADPK